MTKVHQLNPNTPPTFEVPDDLASILDDWLTQQYGDGPPSDPEPQIHHYRHQLLNPDFWFFAGGWLCMLLIFTSFVPMNAFEPLLFAGFILVSCGIVCNLTREKQGIVLHEIRHHHQFSLRLPRWLGFGYSPVRAPMCEQVNW